jgi:3-oxoacyl-[acyl-carrier protein] reductase
VGDTLSGTVVAATGAETPLGGGLCRALRAAGAQVGEIPGDALTTREAADAALAAVAADLGGPIEVLLHAGIPPLAYERVAFEDVDDAHWDGVWEATMRATLFAFQAAYAQMDGRGGRIVLITPTVSMSGAPMLVPFTTAVEGQRLLAKSAARQWGPAGITVNCIAPAPEQVPIGVESMSVSLAPPALGGAGDPEHDLGPIAVFLASEAAHFVTGATISADGGVWMAP